MNNHSFVVQKTFIDGLLVLDPILYRDDRGFFYESFNQKLFNEYVSDCKFVQDNHSRSAKGTIRGLHYQKFPLAQDKLVRCIVGEIVDVAVDLRPDSKTFGLYFSIDLTAENNLQLFIPKGFAHGFQVLSDYAEVNYKTSNYWSRDYEEILKFNDPTIGVNWANLGVQPIISDRDLQGKFFNQLEF